MIASSELPQKGYSAFVSHASADADAAREIVAALESKGLRCWIAPRDVRPGAEYAEDIIRGIEQSKCFVLLVSEASNASAHVRREVERAASKSKPIYPVRIEDVPPSPKLEYFISMHHWLDAWDGVLSEHGKRLAAAIQSEEEWVGNLVQVRRRRFQVGVGVTALLSVAVIVLALVFSSDMRDFFRSPEQRAIAALEEKGISVDAEGLAKALAAASTDDLMLFLDSGVDKQQLNHAFAQTAADFFERSRGSASAIEWLRKAIDRGLDPNLLAPHEHYGKEGILAAAMRSANTDATLALVKAGATPHLYQDLWLSPYSLPRFLFPYHYVLIHDKWTREEKSQVAKAFADAGAVLVPLTPDPGSARWMNYNHSQSLTGVVQNARALFGFAAPETPSACAGRLPTPVCREASERTGRDWCKIMSELPVRVLWKPEAYDHRLLRFDLHHLLNVVNGRGYVLVTDTLGPDGGYGLLEISADLTHWYLYKYVHPAAGMGHCKGYLDGGRKPDVCWRRWEMTYVPERSIVKIGDEYDALFDCKRTRGDR